MGDEPKYQVRKMLYVGDDEDVRRYIGEALLVKAAKYDKILDVRSMEMVLSGTKDWARSANPEVVVNYLKSHVDDFDLVVFSELYLDILKKFKEEVKGYKAKTAVFSIGLEPSHFEKALLKSVDYSGMAGEEGENELLKLLGINAK